MPQMKTEKEIREEARRIRERAKSLSGFWIAELAAAAAALDWTLGKAPRAPSEDIGSRDSAEGKIAASLLKAAEQTAAAAKKPAPKAVSKPAAAGRPAKKKA
jgi:hypothetical protein